MHKLPARLIVSLVITLMMVSLTAPLSAEAVPLRPPPQPRRYAAPGGLTSGTCLDWANACELRYLLSSVATVDTEVWVKAGVYKPTATVGDKSATFNIPPGVAVYGGFDGSEASAEDADPAVNVTILSGDINNDDVNTDGNNIAETWADIGSGNSYHVVTMNGTGTTPIYNSTRLDGFTITAGNAGYDDGGGMVCLGNGTGKACSPILVNLTFSGNRSDGLGGGLLLNGNNGGESSPQFQDVIFQGNWANMGGGVSSLANAGTSSPTFYRVRFKGNHAEHGGGGAHGIGQAAGIYAPNFIDLTFAGNTVGPSFMGGGAYCVALEGWCNPTFANVTFHGNSTGANGMGGALGYYAYDGTINSNLTNVTISGNSASYGGGIANSTTGSSVTHNLTNVILWGNSAPDGPEVYRASTTMTYTNSVVKGSGGSANWNTQFGSDYGGNVDADPKLAPLAFNGGFTATMLLGMGSAALDAGNGTACSAYPVYSSDQRGMPRPQGHQCDIGAVEMRQFTISGYAGIPFAILRYTGGGTHADDLGNYVLIVPEAWTDSITPSFMGYVFTPPSREYFNVMIDHLNDDYLAAPAPPMILGLHPADGSTTCRMPRIGVKLVLTSLVRNADGSFDPTTVMLKLDGVDRTATARVTQSGAIALNEATIWYTPTSNLFAGNHVVQFIYPSPSGTLTRTWNFTAAAGTCPTMTLEESPAVDSPGAAEAPALAAEAPEAAAPSTGGGSALQSPYWRLILRR